MSFWQFIQKIADNDDSHLRSFDRSSTGATRLAKKNYNVSTANLSPRSHANSMHYLKSANAPTNSTTAVSVDSSALQAQVKDLGAELAKTKRKLSGIQCRNRQRIQELDSLRSELARKRRVYESRGEALNNARDRVADTRRALRQRDEELDRTRTMLAEAQEAVSLRDRLLASANAANAASEAELVAIRNMMTEADAAAERRLRVQRDELTRTFAQKGKDLERRIRDLEHERRTAYQLLGAEEHKRRSSTEEVAKLKRDLNDLTTHYAEEFSKAVTSHEARGSTLAKWIKEQQGVTTDTNLTEVLAEVKKLRCECAQLQRGLVAYKEKLTSAESKWEGSQNSSEALYALLNGNISAKMIWAILCLRSTYSQPSLGNQMLSSRHWSSRGLSVEESSHGYVRNDIEAPLSRAQIPQAVSTLTRWFEQEARAGRGMILADCAVCRTPKICQIGEANASQEGTEPNGRSWADFRMGISDFPPSLGRTPCCNSIVCRSCLKKPAETFLEDDWCFAREYDEWVPCPVSGCLEHLKVGNLRGLYDELGFPKARRDRYKRILDCTGLIRYELSRITPTPDKDTLAIASKLYKQLMRNGYAQSMEEKYSPFKAAGKEVWLCEMDQHAFKVPLVTYFMPWSKRTKPCVICANEYRDLDIKCLDQWKRACDGFEGPWMFDIFSFPWKEDLSCDHDMDVCKGCIRDQISSQLESYGSQGWDKLSCPQCNRRITYEEIRKFASKDDFVKYERYHLLDHLSKEPGFRWCLSRSCDSGQLYEPIEFVGPRIACDACSFEMCFKHQVPWHTGLTCDQFDSRKTHTEAEEKTEEWKKQHTKLCPGADCGKPIVKGEGCFHMTCYQCRHQFCWECLADWSAVRSQKSSHKEGCYFRTANVSPTGVQGTSLNVALGVS